jgi:hypothetical protein
MAGAGRLLLLLRLQRLRWRLLWRTVRGADDRAPALRCPDGASSASASRDRFAARCAAIAAVSNLSMPARPAARARYIAIVAVPCCELKESECGKRVRFQKLNLLGSVF